MQDAADGLGGEVLECFALKDLGAAFCGVVNESACIGEAGCSYLASIDRALRRPRR